MGNPRRVPLASQILFAIAAVNNVSIGIALLAFRSTFARLSNLDPIVGTNIVAANLCGALIFIFGVLYALVALEPSSRRDFVWLGVATKTAGPISIAAPMLSGDLAPSPIFLAFALSDILFAALFLLHLRTTRSPSRLPA